MAWLCPHTTGAAAAASVLRYASTFCVGVARGDAALGLEAPSGHLARLLSARWARRAAAGSPYCGVANRPPNATGATSSRNR